TAAIRREAPGAQATSPVPASGADHEKHDRTSPNTHGPPSSDRSRLSRALPCLEGVAQDLEVPTATRSGIRRLAGNHQSRRSLQRTVQAAFARGAVRSSRSASTGAPPVIGGTALTAAFIAPSEGMGWGGLAGVPSLSRRS